MREKIKEFSTDKKLFDFILEKISEGILIVDFQGRINYANSAALSLCDVSEKSLIGSDFTRMFSIDERPRVIELMKTATDKLEAIAEEYPFRLNEHIVSARFLSSGKKDDNSIVIINDVTAQHSAKEELKLRDSGLSLHHKATQMFNSSLKLDQVFVTVLEEVRRLMDVMGCSIWLIEEGTEELVCKQAAGTYGETLVGWRLASGEGLAGWVARHGKSLIAPETSDDERHYKEVDLLIGRDMRSILSVPLRVKGDVIGVLQVVDSQTERFNKKHLALIEPLAGSAAIAIENARLYEKAQQEILIRQQAEEALRESENKYRTVLEANPDSVIVYDKTGKVTYLNPTFTNVFGWTLEECLGKKMDMFIPEKDLSETHEMIKKLLAGENLLAIQTHQNTKSGDVIPVSISSAIFYDSEYQPAGSVVNLRDIREQKKLETQIHQAQKMEAIGTLAGGIAHDYNNLLMAILGNTSLMAFDLRSDHPHYERLKNIEKYVQSGADLTKQLLGLAKGGKYEVKPIDINDVMRKSSEMFNRTKKEIRIHSNYQKDLWRVEADTSQIEQVLLNLYVNASQAMPEGGELYLQTENVTLDDGYTRYLSLKGGNYVKISVTDTGTGMDDNIKKRIFDPFFTTKDIGRGTGLGLASAYGIVKNHRGIINVYSEIDKGSAFNIFLPASTKEVKQDMLMNQKSLKGTGTILLVDDEDMIIDVCSQILASLGYMPLLARSGKEAIDVYQRNRDRIVMVILDMIMPGMGGGETYDRLKKIDSEIRVLLSSGYSLDGQASEIIDRGCNGFIQKPFNVIQLSRKIKEVLGKEP
ncbi:MAG: PAS domain S-box protein [Desulfobacterales bacterium]|nr:PAS domain S-box protein [Desulfobacterales bacterium]